MVEKDGKQGLEIQKETKPYAPPTVRPILLIHGSDYNNVLFSMGVITFLDFGKSSRFELRSDVIIGSQYLIDSEYYHPFKPTSNWFVAPRGGGNSVQTYVYNGDTQIATYRTRQALGGLDVEYGFGTTGELRFGYEGGYEKLSPRNRELGRSTHGLGRDRRCQATVSAEHVGQPSDTTLRSKSSHLHQGVQRQSSSSGPVPAF